MSQTTAVATGTNFQISRVISRSVSLLLKRPFTYGLWIWGPGFLGSILMGVIGVFLTPLNRPNSPGLGTAEPFTEPNVAAGIVLALLPTIFMVAIGAVSCGASMQIAWRDLRRLPVHGMVDALTGASRFFPLFFLTLLAGAALLLGTAFYVLPALFLAATWVLAGPACVVERLGPVSSLGRSRRLTKGRRWETFGLVVTMIAINLGVAVSGLALQPFQPLFGDLFIIPVLIWMLLLLMTIPFWCICSVVAYHDMRVAKEGLYIEQLAAVFD